MGSKRNHHLQPNFYLKGFKSSDEGNPKVWVYEKGKPFYDGKTEQLQNPKHLTTEKAARKKDFYAFEEEDGTKNYNEYEDLLMREYEQPANPVIVKIRKFQEIDEEEKQILFDYVASMLMRSDRWNLVRDYVENAGDPLRKAKIEEDVKEVVTLANEQGSVEYSDPNIVRNILSTHLNNEMKKRRKERYDKDLMVRFIKKFSSDLLDGLKLRFLISPNNIFFITSDNPVCYTPFDDPRVQLLFPISSSICLNLSGKSSLSERTWKRKSNQFWEIDSKTVESIRNFCVRESIKQVYYSQKAEWLVKFINNRDNN